MKLKRIMTAALITAFTASIFNVQPTLADTGTAQYITENLNGSKVNIVYVDMVPGRVGEVGLANNSVVSDEPSSDIIKKQGNKYHLLASVDGGYFNSYYSGSGTEYPNNCPRLYATVMNDGALINGGGNDKLPTLGFTEDGKAVMDLASLTPYVYVDDKMAFSTWGVNSFFTDPTAIMHFTDEMTLEVPLTADMKMAVIQNGVVTESGTGRSIKLTQGMDVLAFGSSAYAQPPQVGSKVTFSVKRSPQRASEQDIWDKVVTAISVGPMLVNNSANVSRNNPSFTEEKQQPDFVALKGFVGVMKDGRIIMGTATASNAQLADYLVKIGCTDAMSLDGGASTMLYTPQNGFITSAGRELSNVLSIVDKYKVSEPSVAYAGSDSAIKVTVNGKELSFSTEPKITNGTTFVPMRAIFEALGAKVDWKGETRTVYAQKGSTSIELVCGQTSGTVNGKTITLPAAAYIDTSSSSTMVPLRFVSESLGCDVQWNPSDKSVTITD